MFAHVFLLACTGVIDTDRPHQTDTPHVVPPGCVQVESALAALAVSDGPAPVRVLVLENNYKVGAAPGVDLQMAFKHAEYVPARSGFAPPGPLSLRAKFNVVREDGATPAITLVPWVFVPVASSQPVRAGPLVFWGWELPAGFELEMNAGAFVSARPKPPVAAVLATALTYTVFGAFRVFADVDATGWDIALGTGALWAFARDAQIDAGTYIGVSGDEPRATPFVGLSIRR